MVGIWWFTVNTTLPIFKVADRVELGDSFLKARIDKSF
jgi:hypothetical protein